MNVPEFQVQRPSFSQRLLHAGSYVHGGRKNSNNGTPPKQKKSLILKRNCERIMYSMWNCWSKGVDIEKNCLKPTLISNHSPRLPLPPPVISTCAWIVCSRLRLPQNLFTVDAYPKIKATLDWLGYENRKQRLEVWNQLSLEEQDASWISRQALIIPSILLKSITLAIKANIESKKPIT